MLKYKKKYNKRWELERICVWDNKRCSHYYQIILIDKPRNLIYKSKRYYWDDYDTIELTEKIHNGYMQLKAYFIDGMKGTLI